MDPLEVRFTRLSDALASAVSLLPPPQPTPNDDTDFTASNPWPPIQPEVQVAVLVASEAAARQELMFAREAFCTMQTQNASPLRQRFLAETPNDAPNEIEDRVVHSELVCSLLEAVLAEVVGLLGNRDSSGCSVAFRRSLEALTAAEVKYETLVVSLQNALLDNNRDESVWAGLLLSPNGSIPDVLNRIAVLDMASLSETTRQAVDSLHRMLRGDLRIYLEKILPCAEKGELLPELNPNDDVLAQRLTALLNLRAYKNAVATSSQTDPDTHVQTPKELVYQQTEDNYNALRTYLQGLEESGVASLTALSPNDQELVTHLQDRMSLQPKNNDADLSSQYGNLRAYLQDLIDSKLGNLDSLSPTDREVGQRLNSLLFHQYQQQQQSHEAGVHLDALRAYLADAIGSGLGDLDNLSPADQKLMQQLSKLLPNPPQQHHQDVSTRLSRLAQSISDAVQKDEDLRGVLERIQAVAEKTKMRKTSGDKNSNPIVGTAVVLDCFARLVDGLATTRARHAQAEKDKVALGQLVRSKHAESQAYHAQLQQLLTAQHQQQTAVSV